jgi:hypothetical protein
MKTHKLKIKNLECMGCAGNKKQYLSFLSKKNNLIIKYSSTYFWTGSAALEELRSHTPFIIVFLFNKIF